MERELWELLCRLAEELYRSIPRGRYGDDEILAVYLWSVIHDRPVCWSCDPQHWPDSCRPRRLPSQPTMSIRLRSGSVEQLLHAIEHHLLALSGVASYWVRVIDAKGLPVGGPSRDIDAQWGRGACGPQHGYKFHAVWGPGPLPLAWALTPMNINEGKMARDLIEELPSGGYLLADSQYDHNALYEIAAAAGYQLVAARQRPGTGLGHRRHSPYRLRSMELLQHRFGRALYRQRMNIEHCFAGLVSFAGGLAPLPFWIRRFHRVRTWVQAKLLINAVRILRKKHLPAIAVK